MPKEQGEKVVATNRNGLVHGPVDGPFSVFTAGDGLANDQLLSLASEPDGTVWVGGASVICPGVSIGRRSVIDSGMASGRSLHSAGMWPRAAVSLSPCASVRKRTSWSRTCGSSMAGRPSRRVRRASSTTSSTPR